jgi:DNA-binding NarL/FixJ family response regulator
MILSAPSESAAKQVQQIKLMWPTTHLLVLADAGQAELLAAGADAVLPKDFSSKELLQAIKLLPCSTVISHLTMA